ncbi:hypothetical protein SNE40_015710 [Patella caerulea]|uniref:C2H2-type domain-containing protein n=1 Tax=Patella caerulea TaxID=87958 RepID=A0AAN8JKG9_PATCE
MSVTTQATAAVPPTAQQTAAVTPVAGTNTTIPASGSADYSAYTSGYGFNYGTGQYQYTGNGQYDAAAYAQYCNAYNAYYGYNQYNYQYDATTGQYSYNYYGTPATSGTVATAGQTAAAPVATTTGQQASTVTSQPPLPPPPAMPAITAYQTSQNNTGQSAVSTLQPPPPPPDNPSATATANLVAQPPLPAPPLPVPPVPPQNFSYGNYSQSNPIIYPQQPTMTGVQSFMPPPVTQSNVQSYTTQQGAYGNYYNQQYQNYQTGSTGMTPMPGQAVQPNQPTPATPAVTGTTGQQNNAYQQYQYGAQHPPPVMPPNGQTQNNNQTYQYQQQQQTNTQPQNNQQHNWKNKNTYYDANSAAFTTPTPAPGYFPNTGGMGNNKRKRRKKRGFSSEEKVNTPFNTNYTDQWSRPSGQNKMLEMKLTKGDDSQQSAENQENKEKLILRKDLGPADVNKPRGTFACLFGAVDFEQDEYDQSTESDSDHEDAKKATTSVKSDAEKDKSKVAEDKTQSTNNKNKKSENPNSLVPQTSTQQPAGESDNKKGPIPSLLNMDVEKPSNVNIQKTSRKEPPNRFGNLVAKKGLDPNRDDGLEFDPALFGLPASFCGRIPTVSESDSIEEETPRRFNNRTERPSHHDRFQKRDDKPDKKQSSFSDLDKPFLVGRKSDKFVSKFDRGPTDLHQKDFGRPQRFGWNKHEEPKGIETDSQQKDFRKSQRFVLDKQSNTFHDVAKDIETDLKMSTMDWQDDRNDFEMPGYDMDGKVMLNDDKPFSNRNARDQRVDWHNEPFGDRNTRDQQMSRRGWQGESENPEGFGKQRILNNDPQFTGSERRRPYRNENLATEESSKPPIGWQENDFELPTSFGGKAQRYDRTREQNAGSGDFARNPRDKHFPETNFPDDSSFEHPSLFKGNPQQFARDMPPYKASAPFDNTMDQAFPESVPLGNVDDFELPTSFGGKAQRYNRDKTSRQFDERPPYDIPYHEEDWPEDKNDFELPTSFGGKAQRYNRDKTSRQFDERPTYDRPYHEEHWPEDKNDFDLPTSFGGKTQPFDRKQQNRLKGEIPPLLGENFLNQQFSEPGWSDNKNDFDPPPHFGQVTQRKDKSQSNPHVEQGSLLLDEDLRGQRFPEQKFPENRWQDDRNDFVCSLPYEKNEQKDIMGLNENRKDQSWKNNKSQLSDFELPTSFGGKAQPYVREPENEFRDELFRKDQQWPPEEDEMEEWYDKNKSSTRHGMGQDHLDLSSKFEENTFSSNYDRTQPPDDPYDKPGFMDERVDWQHEDVSFRGPPFDDNFDDPYGKSNTQPPPFGKLGNSGSFRKSDENPPPYRNQRFERDIYHDEDDRPSFDDPFANEKFHDDTSRFDNEHSFDRPPYEDLPFARGAFNDDVHIEGPFGKRNNQQQFNNRPPVDDVRLEGPFGKKSSATFDHTPPFTRDKWQDNSTFGKRDEQQFFNIQPEVERLPSETPFGRKNDKLPANREPLFDEDILEMPFGKKSSRKSYENVSLEGPFGKKDRGHPPEITLEGPFGRKDRGPPPEVHLEGPFGRKDRGPPPEVHLEGPFGRKDRGPPPEVHLEGPFGRKDRGPPPEVHLEGPFGRKDRGPPPEVHLEGPFGRKDRGPPPEVHLEGPFGRKDRGPPPEVHLEGPFGRKDRGPPPEVHLEGPFGKKKDRPPFGSGPPFGSRPAFDEVTATTTFDSMNRPPFTQKKPFGREMVKPDSKKDIDNRTFDKPEPLMSMVFNPKNNSQPLNRDADALKSDSNTSKKARKGFSDSPTQPVRKDQGKETESKGVRPVPVTMLIGTKGSKTSSIVNSNPGNLLDPKTKKPVEEAKKSQTNDPNKTAVDRPKSPKSLLNIGKDVSKSTGSSAQQKSPIPGEQNLSKQFTKEETKGVQITNLPKDPPKLNPKPVSNDSGSNNASPMNTQAFLLSLKTSGGVKSFTSKSVEKDTAKTAPITSSPKVTASSVSSSMATNPLSSGPIKAPNVLSKDSTGSIKSFTSKSVEKDPAKTAPITSSPKVTASSVSSSMATNPLSSCPIKAPNVSSKDSTKESPKLASSDGSSKAPNAPPKDSTKVSPMPVFSDSSSKSSKLPQQPPGIGLAPKPASKDWSSNSTKVTVKPVTSAAKGSSSGPALEKGSTGSTTKPSVSSQNETISKADSMQSKQPTASPQKGLAITPTSSSSVPKPVIDKGKEVIPKPASKDWSAGAAKKPVTNPGKNLAPKPASSDWSTQKPLVSSGKEVVQKSAMDSKQGMAPKPASKDWSSTNSQKVIQPVTKTPISNSNEISTTPLKPAPLPQSLASTLKSVSVPVVPLNSSSTVIPEKTDTSNPSTILTDKSKDNTSQQPVPSPVKGLTADIGSKLKKAPAPHIIGQLQTIFNDEANLKVKDLMLVTKCMVCSVNLSSQADAVQHYQGKSHRKKVAAFKDSPSITKTQPPPLKKTGTTPVSVITTVEKTADAKNYCKLCDMTFSNPDQATNHYIGKDHANRQLQVPVPVTKEKVFECTLCNITVTSQETLNIHFNGAKHKNKAKNAEFSGIEGKVTGGARGGNNSRGRGGTAPTNLMDFNQDEGSSRGRGRGGARGRGGFGTDPERHIDFNEDMGRGAMRGGRGGRGRQPMSAMDDPGFGRPEFDEPGFSRPEFDDPGFGRPEFDFNEDMGRSAMRGGRGGRGGRGRQPMSLMDDPGFGRPEFDEPRFGRPEFDEPRFGRPDFDDPGFDRPRGMPGFRGRGGRGRGDPMWEQNRDFAPPFHQDGRHPDNYDRGPTPPKRPRRFALNSM